MPIVLDPFRFVLIAVGWMNQRPFGPNTCSSARESKHTTNTTLVIPQALNSREAALAHLRICRFVFARFDVGVMH
jgi:hypothetical protein